MMTFGSYFCFDMPSVLQDTFTAQLHPNKTMHNCTTIDGKPASGLHSNGTNCTSGLGLTETQYNLLYSIYAWTNAIVVILAGFLIDKLGNPIGALLFSFMCLAGTSVFAVGLYFKGGAAMFPLFLLGRIMFGSGNGALTSTVPDKFAFSNIFITRNTMNFHPFSLCIIGPLHLPVSLTIDITELFIYGSLILVFWSYPSFEKGGLGTSKRIKVIVRRLKENFDKLKH